MKKVCLVIGAGAGIGGTGAKKFASDGFHAYLARRTDEQGLNKLIDEIIVSNGHPDFVDTSFKHPKINYIVDFENNTM